jgi:hypothetical protein
MRITDFDVQTCGDLAMLKCSQDYRVMEQLDPKYVLV